MPRPFTDITNSLTDQPIKNGSSVCSTTFKGLSTIANDYVKNEPVLADIESKYGYRYYNGILVQLSSGTTLVGG